MSDVRQFVHRPSPALRRYVREVIWVHSSHARVQLLLPETTLTLVLRQAGAASLHNQPLPQTIVSGLQQQTRTIDHAPNSSMVIVRFTEIGAPAILHDRADLLYNQTLPLEDVLPRHEIDDIQNTLADTPEITRQILTIEKFLATRIRAHEVSPQGISPRISPQIEAAATMIRRSHGRASIQAIARHAAMSLSALERQFRAARRNPQKAQPARPTPARLPPLGRRKIPHRDRLRRRLLRSTSHGARLPALHRRLPRGVLPQHLPAQSADFLQVAATRPSLPWEA